MKILFLTNHLEGTDGWSRVSLDYIRELQNLGCNILCLTHRGPNPLLAPPLRYLANPLISFITASKIRRKIKEFSPDVIHFMVEPYANILPFLGKLEAKTCLTCHGTYAVIPNLIDNFLKKRVSHYLSKNYFQKLTGIIAVSNYTKDYLLKYYPETASKIKVITNGVNLEEYGIVNLSQKPQNKIKKILFVGAVKERKGVLQAIEACRHYRDNFSADFIYDIVGNHSEESRYYQILIKKIKEYNLEDKIFFRGRVAESELKKYYFGADLFLMPSLHIDHNFEGFGLVFLEAAAFGVPCLGSKDSGSREAILEGETGYVADPFDFKEIARKMDLILNQNTIRGEDCLNWAKQNDIKIKARELLNFYQNEIQAQK